MSRVAAAFLAALVASAPAFAAPAVLAAAFAAPIAATAPQQRAEAVLAAVDREAGIEVSVRVETLDGGVVLDHDGGTPRILASNTKLLTTAAALLALDPDSRWTTRCLLDGRTLWVVGDGDPSMRRTAQGDGARAFLDALAAALADAGVDALDEVVLDARAFPGPVRPPGWPAAQWQKDHCAPSAALQVAGSRLWTQLVDGALELYPPLGEELAIVRTGKDEKTFQVWWQAGPELVVKGRTELPEPAAVAVEDPLWLYRAWLRHGLAARGVSVGALRLAEGEEAAPETAPLLEHASLWTLAEAVAVVNKDSDNQLAESLLCTLGLRGKGTGTREAGLEAVREGLAGLGVDLEGLHQVDGSGMSRDAADVEENRASPAALCALLRLMAEQEQGRVLFLSLPVGGEEGRMAARFRDPVFDDGRVRAKTGFITGASSLSGYLHAHDGTLLVFSIVVNYKPDGKPRTHNARFKRMQEEMLAALLEERPWI